MGVLASARELREDRVKQRAPKKKAKEKERECGGKGGRDNVQRQNMEVDDNQDDRRWGSSGEGGRAPEGSGCRILRNRAASCGRLENNRSTSG